MSFSMMRGVRLSLVLAAAGTIIAVRAEAQPSRPAALPPGAVVQQLTPDNGAELRRHLMTLSDNPRSLDALIGAGRAALAGGDTQAALTFFSRAGEVAPRDSRVKAGMASVLVRMERGQPALNLFAEAVALGAPAIEIAGDRGLAHDMVGDPRRAQQDYAMVLQRREDPEVRRRLALSLAISGERDAALRVIDGQLRRNERAAWRTQAFILALTGDAVGANRTAQGLMPPAAAAAMAPFFSRLTTLTPSQKAMAAHFGRFPSNGRTAAASGSDTRADPGALALATGTQPARPRTQSADPSPGATRRRPGTGQPAAQRSDTRSQPSGASQSRANPTAVAARNPSVPPRQTATGPSASAARSNTNEGLPARRGPVVTVVPFPTQPSAPINSPQSEAASEVSRPFAVQPFPSTTSPGADSNASASASASASSSPATEIPTSISATNPISAADTGARTALAVNDPAAVTSPPPANRGIGQVVERPLGDLADIAAVVATLPEDDARAAREPSTSRPAPARVPAQPTARNSSSTARPAATRARPAQPSRHWVQIAGGANAAALPRELARLRAQAPELADRDAWMTPANATNRLLVGPFSSPTEAQDFVNGLARRNISAFVWTSTAGQEIARLRPGR